MSTYYPHLLISAFPVSLSAALYAFPAGRHRRVRAPVPGRLCGVDAGGSVLRGDFLRAPAGVRAAREQEKQQRVARGRGGRGKGLRGEASQQAQDGGELVVSLPPRPVTPGTRALCV